MILTNPTEKQMKVLQKGKYNISMKMINGQTIADVRGVVATWQCEGCGKRTLWYDEGKNKWGDLANNIHRSFAENEKYCRICGKSKIKKGSK